MFDDSKGSAKKVTTVPFENFQATHTRIICRVFMIARHARRVSEICGTMYTSKSRRALSNEPSIANIGGNTAENGPSIHNFDFNYVQYPLSPLARE